MRDKKDSVLGLIGLATKARMTITGAEACETAIRAQKPKLVIVAKDVTDNTKIPIVKLCEYRQIKVIEFATKDELGKHTGKPTRAVVAITDEGFAKRIIEILDE